MGLPRAMDGELREVVEITTRLLITSGFEREGRLLLRTPLNRQSQFTCLLRRLRSIEQTVDARWAATMRGPGLTGRLMELVIHLKLATTKALIGEDIGQHVEFARGLERLHGTEADPHGGRTLGEQTGTTAEPSRGPAPSDR